VLPGKQTSTQRRQIGSDVSQLRAAMATVTVAGATLPVSEEIRLLRVIIDRRLTFDSHIKCCNYHLQALQHIHHLLPFYTAQTLACSLILSRLDYYNDAAP